MDVEARRGPTGSSRDSGAARDPAPGSDKPPRPDDSPEEDGSARPTLRGAAGRTDPPGHRDDADGHGGEGGERGEAAEGEADEDKNEKKPLPRWKKVLYAAIAAAVLIVVAVAGVLYWMLQRYRQGLADYHQVLTAQRSLLGAEQQLADSTATVGTNLVALYKALGGGWETRFPDAPSGPPPPTRTASAAAR